MEGFLARFARKNVEEIAGDPALRAYGAALALVHLVTRIHWGLRGGMNVPWVLGGNDMAVCWPFFERCKEFRTLAEGTWRILFDVYGIVAVACAALFLARRTRAASSVLLGLSIGKWLILVQDFRFGGNYHYMAFVSTAGFLFLPGKRDLGRLLVVAYYLAAARLKFDYDWLTGSALFHEVIFTGPLLRVATTYVVILETIVVFGLLARGRVWFWSAFIQFALFHAYSVVQVGAPYPLFMACLLSIFPLSRWAERDKKTNESLLFRLPSGGADRAHYAALALFAAAQAVPSFYPGDPALTGRGRSFALSMLDARTSCDVLALARRSPFDREEIGIERVPVFPRLHCDPVVFASFARDACTDLRNRTPDADLDVYGVARRAGDVRFTPLFAMEGACSRPAAPSIVRRTDWILP